MSQAQAGSTITHLSMNAFEAEREITSPPKEEGAGRSDVGVRSNEKGSTKADG